MTSHFAAAADTLMADAVDTIVLDVHVPNKGRSIRVSFATEAQAVAYYRRHAATRAMDDFNPDAPTIDPVRHPVLWALMHPVCAHGLSLANCYGPGHYSDL